LHEISKKKRRRGKRRISQRVGDWGKKCWRSRVAGGSASSGKGKLPGGEQAGGKYGKKETSEDRLGENKKKTFAGDYTKKKELEAP